MSTSTLRSSSISRVSSNGSWPFNNPRCYSSRNSANNIVVIPKSEYERMKTAAVVLSKEERLRQQMKIYQATLEKQSELENETARSENRTFELKSPTEVNGDAEKCEELREILKLHRLEQEDEIKKTNEIIFEAKCLADREKQILEKQHRLKHAKKLDQELEQHVVKQQLELEEKRRGLEESKKASQKNLAKIMKHQIEEHTRARDIAKERLKEWESLQMQKRIEEFKLQQTREQLEKIEKQQKLKEGLEECLREKNRLRSQLIEEERKRLEHLHKQRLQREKLEETIQEERQRKEKLQQIRSAHMSRVWNTYHNKPRDTTAIKIRREKEAMDRTWRQRELERASKQAEEKELLRVARENQIREKLKMKEDIEMRKRQEHTKMIEADKSAVDEEKRATERRHAERLQYMTEIRQQIIEKEERAHQFRDQHLRDSKEYRKKIAEHDKLMQEMKTKKLQDLRSLNVPEKFMKEVARKSKIPWTNLE